MKFLKRLGKKIKKGVKKLMGSKIGRIVGMIGLSMAMGAATKALIGNFGTATTTAATETAALTAGETVGATAGETVGATVGETVGATAGSTEQVLANMTNASTNSEAMSLGIDRMMSETVASNGMVNPDALTLHNSITDSVVELNETVFNPEYTNSLKNENLLSRDLPSFKEQLESGTLTADASGVTSIAPPEAPSLLEPIEIEVTGQYRRPAGMSDVDFANYKPSPDHIAEGIKANEWSSASVLEKAGSKAREFGTEFKEKFKEGLNSPGEIAANVVTGTATGLAMSAILGEDEYPAARGQVIPQAQMEGPKAAYIQDITPSFQAATNQNITPTFQNLSTYPLSGRGTPQWLQMFENQNLLMPSALGIQIPYRNTTALV